MLRTNSKKARENIREYISNNFTPDNYGKTWELYLDGDDHETFDGSVYDLISVDTY